MDFRSLLDVLTSLFGSIYWPVGLALVSGCVAVAFVAKIRRKIRGSWQVKELLDGYVLTAFTIATLALAGTWYFCYRYRGLPSSFKGGQIGILVGEVPGDKYQEEQSAYAREIYRQAENAPELKGIVRVEMLRRPLPADPARQQAKALQIGRWERATFVLRPAVVEGVQEPWITIVGQPQFSRSETQLDKFPNAEFPELDELPLPRNLLLLARCAVGLLFYREQLYVKGSGEFQRVLESRKLPVAAPSRPELYLILGRCLALSGKYVDAAQAFGKAICLAPKFAEAHSSLGFVLESAGLLEAARTEYSKAIEIKPNCVEAHIDLGTDLNLMGRNGEAVGQYERAIALDPNDPHPHSGLCTVFDEEGQYLNAIAECQKAIRLRPTYATPYNELGLVLRDEGQCSDAISEFKKMLALGVRDAQVHDNLGAALECSGDLDGAISQFNAAITLKPDFAHAYYNLGSALMDNGQYSEAIKDLRRAVFLEPYDPNPRLALAEALKAAHEGRKAGQMRQKNAQRPLPKARSW